MKSSFLIFAVHIAVSSAFSQDMTATGSEDSIRTINLSQVEILSKKINNDTERIAFEKLKRNTLKVYPYAVLASQIYSEMKQDVSDSGSKRARKKYLNEKEKNLRDRFEKEIRDLSRTQGNILIKLINRYSGNSCYEIVKEMKGGVTAFFWNMGGKFYDHNLKEEYKPEENADLELILKMIANGQLQVKVIQ